MIRVWIPAGAWTPALAEATSGVLQCRVVNRTGRRVQICGTAGGIECVRRAAAARAALLLRSDVAEELGTLPAAQLTLAALSRLGWRPIPDDATVAYPRPLAASAAVVEGMVVGRIRCAWINSILLRDESKARQGFGRAAVLDFETWARDQGAQVVRLLAARSVSGFWMRLGYDVASTDAGGHVRMVKLLAETAGVERQVGSHTASR